MEKQQMSNTNVSIAMLNTYSASSLQDIIRPNDDDAHECRQAWKNLKIPTLNGVTAAKLAEEKIKRHLSFISEFEDRGESQESLSI